MTKLKPIAKIKTRQQSKSFEIIIDDIDQYLDQSRQQRLVAMFNCYLPLELAFIMQRYMQLPIHFYDPKGIEQFFEIAQANILAAIEPIIINDDKAIIAALLNNNRFFETDHNENPFKKLD